MTVSCRYRIIGNACHATLLFTFPCSCIYLFFVAVDATVRMLFLLDSYWCSFWFPGSHAFASTNISYLDYMTLFNRETQANLNLLREDTNTNFARMDEKYHLISENMIAIVNSIEERNKTFENKIEKIENRMEKTEKSIESLLKILAEK